MNAISYSSVLNYKSRNNIYAGSNKERQNTEKLSKCMETRNQIRKLSNEQNENKHVGYLNESVLSNITKYSESVRAQRTKSSDTSLNKKKLKYSFKSISSKIVRSKTSVAARQVVAQAKREVQRLKKERQSGKYDSDEIEEALNHAKAMEMIARKKVKHLEEEERAQRGRGICEGDRIGEEYEEDKELEAMDDAENAQDNAADEEINQGGDEAYIPEGYDLESMSTLAEKFAEFEEMTREVLSDYEDALKEMFEEMDLSELTDSLLGASGDMDPEDIKELKIKHRNKEMKDIVEADSKYLKAMFESLEKTKSGGMSNVGAVNMSGAGVAMDGFADVGLQAVSASDFSTSIDVSV